ncbi:hypothetical protein EV363DRAFT_65206 [Boletus edulis]|nr:hypothetical protein EV363DRAFT_65206 [Boletus edulis]
MKPIIPLACLALPLSISCDILCRFHPFLSLHAYPSAASLLGVRALLRCGCWASPQDPFVLRLLGSWVNTFG